METRVQFLKYVESGPDIDLRVTGSSDSISSFDRSETGSSTGLDSTSAAGASTAED